MAAFPAVENRPGDLSCEALRGLPDEGARRYRGGSRRKEFSMSYATIAVGTDGSESSLRAVQRAAEVSAATGAALFLVCAYHPMTAREQAVVTPAGGDARFRVTGKEPAQEALEAAERQARETGAARVEQRLVE